MIPRRSFSLFLCVALAISTAARAGAPIVTHAVLLRDDGKGGAGQEVARFHPADRSQHFRVRLAGIKLGRLSMKWIFMAVHTTAGDSLKLAEADGISLLTNEIDGSVTLPRDWPLGSYRAELYLDGRPLKTIDYAVVPAVGPIVVKKIQLRRDDGHGGPGEVVQSFRPTDRKLHFEAETDGLAPGTRARWVYTAVDTTAGKNVSVAEGEFASDDPAATVVTSYVELPRNWPSGRYRGDVYVGDKLVKSFEFAVR